MVVSRLVEPTVEAIAVGVEAMPRTRYASLRAKSSTLSALGEG